jgi:glycosyltransferase involved in cell wall biosynthesis
METKKIKLLALNIAFREESFYKRWRLLSKEYNMDVTLVGPKYDSYELAGPPIVFNPQKIVEDGFNVLQIDMVPKKWLKNDFFGFDFFKILLTKRPDFIYLIGLETQNVVFWSKLYVLLFNRKSKIALFSMRGTVMPLNLGFDYRFRWYFTSKIFDLINCHYPYGREIFRIQGGFKKPIYLQTQIGVNKDVFYPDEVSRAKIRNKYNIDASTFVFSSAIRIEELKGVFDIIEACVRIKQNYKFLLMGDGKDFNKIVDLIKRHSLENMVIITGRIASGADVAAHLNASDCYIHIPKSSPDWVDTFPLSVVQAMAVGLPIIGSNSGAVPYQIGDESLIIEEGDIDALVLKMILFIENKKLASDVGKRLLDRVINNFEIRHLNTGLVNIINAYVNHKDYSKIKDQTDN